MVQLTQTEFDKALTELFNDIFTDFLKIKTSTSKETSGMNSSINSELKRENSDLHGMLVVKNRQIDNQSKSIKELRSQVEQLKIWSQQQARVIREMISTNEKLKLEIIELEDVYKTCNARLNSVLIDLVNSLGLSDYYKEPEHWPQLLDMVVRLNNFKAEVRKALND